MLASQDCVFRQGFCLMGVPIFPGLPHQVMGCLASVAVGPQGCPGLAQQVIEGECERVDFGMLSSDPRIEVMTPCLHDLDFGLVDGSARGVILLSLGQCQAGGCGAERVLDDGVKLSLQCIARTNSWSVRPGDIGNRMCLRHG